jgi:hypothetical protein
VDDWYALHSADDAVRSALDARMVFLRQQPRDYWTRPRYDLLKGAGGIGEVRFKVDRIQHRALGYFGPRRMEFTFLEMCTKTDGNSLRKAIKSAKERKQEIDKDPNLSVLVNRWGQ